MAYTDKIPKYGTLMTVEEFKQDVENGCLMDDDGWGKPVKNKLVDNSIDIEPTEIYKIPEDATHIVWFNK